MGQGSKELDWMAHVSKFGWIAGHVAKYKKEELIPSTNIVIEFFFFLVTHCYNVFNHSGFLVVGTAKEYIQHDHVKEFRYIQAIQLCLI